MRETEHNCSKLANPQRAVGPAKPRCRHAVTRGASQRGTWMVEFAVVMIFLVPMLLGSFSIGMSLQKSVQASLLARDAGSMFMRGVMFRDESSRKMITDRLGRGMNITDNGGQGVVVLSEILGIGDTQCTAANLAPGGTGGPCPNNGYPVVVRRTTIGNASLLSTHFGSPPLSDLSSEGLLSSAVYLVNTACRATIMQSLMPLGAGERAYVAEVYFKTPEVDLPGYRNNTGVYQRNIF